MPFLRLIIKILSHKQLVLVYNPSFQRGVFLYYPPMPYDQIDHFRHSILVLPFALTEVLAKQAFSTPVS